MPKPDSGNVKDAPRSGIASFATSSERLTGDQRNLVRRAYAESRSMLPSFETWLLDRIATVVETGDLWMLDRAQIDRAWAAITPEGKPFKG